jgi:uncharacterized protein
MAKFLLFLAVVAAIYFVVRASNRRRRPPQQAHETPDSKEMTRCGYCQVYFPRAEALNGNGEEFCCEEHRRLRARE